MTSQPAAQHEESLWATTEKEWESHVLFNQRREMEVTKTEGPANSYGSVNFQEQIDSIWILLKVSDSSKSDIPFAASRER